MPESVRGQTRVDNSALLAVHAQGIHAVLSPSEIALFAD